MAIDTILIMIICALITYFSFKKLSKRRWKILTFIGVFLFGFIATIMMGVFVSTVLHDGDFGIVQRYLGNSIVMPLIGCFLGVYLEIKIKKNSTKKNSKLH
jgi:uncharacterized membrane protein